MKLNKSATLTRVTTVRTMERERGMAVAIGKRLTACRMMSFCYTALVQSQATIYESNNFYFPMIYLATCSSIVVFRGSSPTKLLSPLRTKILKCEYFFKVSLSYRGVPAISREVSPRRKS